MSLVRYSFRGRYLHYRYLPHMVWYGEPVAAAQLAACLLSFVIVLVLLERWSRGKRRYFHTTNRYQQLPEYALHGWRAIAATVACAIPITIDFCCLVASCLT